MCPACMASGALMAASGASTGGLTALLMKFLRSKKGAANVQRFPSEEGPGLSVFYKDTAGNIFHTYSAYGRGLDMMIGAYNWLDLTPKGRDEDGLAFTMSWVRHHDRYSEGYSVDAKQQYVQPAISDTSCCLADEHRHR